MGRIRETRKREKMEDALRYICRYWETEGFSPTVREIQEHLGMQSTSTAWFVLCSLQESGYISMQEGKPRTIRVLHGI